MIIQSGPDWNQKTHCRRSGYPQETEWAFIKGRKPTEAPACPLRRIEASRQAGIEELKKIVKGLINWLIVN